MCARVHSFFFVLVISKTINKNNIDGMRRYDDAEHWALLRCLFCKDVAEKVFLQSRVTRCRVCGRETFRKRDGRPYCSEECYEHV